MVTLRRFALHMECGPRRASGFTLIELVVVLAVISLVVGIAFPQLWPLIALSRLEGAARHLAGYGRSAMAYCTMMREPIVVKIDLKTQTYRAVHPYKRASRLFEDDTQEDTDQEPALEPSQMAEMLERGNVPDAELLAQEGAARLRERFEEFARIRMQALATNVKRKGILDEIGPLFEDEFSLEDEEEKEEEVANPLLMRTTVAEDVWIESVVVGQTTYTEGEVEIAFSPLGLFTPVQIVLKSADGDYYSVAWDPITGGAYVREGKEDLLGLS